VRWRGPGGNTLTDANHIIDEPKSEGGLVEWSYQPCYPRNLQ
jgi:hypothetical protein